MAYGNKGKTYYKVRRTEKGSDNLIVTKFNQDLDVESSYNMDYMPSQNGGYYDCHCPASKFDCRHKDIMKRIRDADEIDGDKFFCFETKTFHSMESL